MKFTPKSEKEIQEAMLFKAGEYDFEVLEASDEVSKKSGNPMIKLELGLYVESDRINRTVTDYVLPTMEAKLRHFCDCVGLLAEYESGSLSADMCKGRSGKVKIAIQADKNGQYPDKNAVRDYCIRKAKPLDGGKTISHDAATMPGSTEKPDDLPF